MASWFVAYGFKVILQLGHVLQQVTLALQHVMA